MISQPSSVQQSDTGVTGSGHLSLDVITAVDGDETQGSLVMEELNLNVLVDQTRAEWPNQEQIKRLIRYCEDGNYVCQICEQFTPDGSLIMSHILEYNDETWRTFDPAALLSVLGASDQNPETVASVSGALNTDMFSFATHNPS